jgi:hypothetical protein
MRVNWRTARRRGSAMAVLTSWMLVAASACGSPAASRPTSPAGGAGPGIDAHASPSIASPAPPTLDPAMAAAPYLYLGGEGRPDPRTIMTATGVRWFTVAFVLSHGPCDPQWDGTRPLIGGSDQRTIASIRDGGGDVVVSFGGQSGPWLEQSCPTAAQLAAAYQRVIDAYKLKAIDIDVEGTVYSSRTGQQRIIDALKIIRAANPGLTISVTFPIESSGPDPGMINRAAAAGLVVDCWTAMPFDMDAAGQDMGALTQRLLDQLAAVVRAAYGLSDDQAYRRVGISSMNGITDAHERVTQADFQVMLDYARLHHLGRLTFWSANRDRSCGAGIPPGENCSGVPQAAWDFTRIVAQYLG